MCIGVYRKNERLRANIKQPSRAAIIVNNDVYNNTAAEKNIKAKGKKKTDALVKSL